MRLGVLISGRGSNFEAISNSINRRKLDAEIAADPTIVGKYYRDMLAQTKRLIEDVLPRVAARWPKQRKAA